MWICAIATTGFASNNRSRLHRLDPPVKLAVDGLSGSSSGNSRLARSGVVVLLIQHNLNSCDSATGMAAANGLAIDAVVFCPAHLGPLAQTD